MTFNILKIFLRILMQRYCNRLIGNGKILNHLANTQLFVLKVAITLLYYPNYHYILLYINLLHPYVKLLLKTKPQACVTIYFIIHLPGHRTFGCRGSPNTLNPSCNS